MRANPGKKVALPALAAETGAAVRSSSTPNGADTRDAMIRAAAYRCYERRGHVPGHEIEDWLRAEMEVDGQMNDKPGPDPAR
ncbi:MAG: DUF2934 domain-containing protein [Ideonella sp.]|nr:DUF2934 domain-containing protein [Ideonella sp.]